MKSVNNQTERPKTMPDIQQTNHKTNGVSRRGAITPWRQPGIDDELLYHEADRKVSRGDLIPATEIRLSGIIACYTCSHFTRHKYLGKRPVKDFSGNTIYMELIYTCGCGKERVWGTENLFAESVED